MATAEGHAAGTLGSAPAPATAAGEALTVEELGPAASVAPGVGGPGRGSGALKHPRQIGMSPFSLLHYQA